MSQTEPKMITIPRVVVVAIDLCKAGQRYQDFGPLNTPAGIMMYVYSQIRDLGLTGEVEKACLAACYRDSKLGKRRPPFNELSEIDAILNNVFPAKIRLALHKDAASGAGPYADEDVRLIRNAYESLREEGKGMEEIMPLLLELHTLLPDINSGPSAQAHDPGISLS